MGDEGGTRGWKLSGISAEEYARLLKAYDAELQKDSYVLGATVFTSGPTPDWENYSMDGLEPLFMEEEAMAWKDILPRSFQAFKSEGGTDESFESIIQTWVDAGGDVEESALRYLVGTRRLKATQSRIEYLTNKGKSAFQELNDAVSPHLPLA